VIKPADYGKPAVPVKTANTADAALVATYRRGKFGYSIAVASCRHDVRLSFVEPSAAAGQRLFDVLANGNAVLRNLGVAATAGGPMTAVVRSDPVEVFDGQLRLSFTPTRGDAIVSAIEVIAR
jgi:beta-galactosidase